jgi:hypothetical protein
VLEGKQHGEDGTTDGLESPREAIELPLEGAAQGLNPLGCPRGQIGEGPRTDLVPVAEGFTQENSRGRVTIGNSCNIPEGVYNISTAIKKEEAVYLHDYIIDRKID